MSCGLTLQNRKINGITVGGLFFSLSPSLTLNLKHTGSLSVSLPVSQVCLSRCSVLHFRGGRKWKGAASRHAPWWENSPTTCPVIYLSFGIDWLKMPQSERESEIPNIKCTYLPHRQIVISLLSSPSVCPSVPPFVRPSVRRSVRPSATSFYIDMRNHLLALFLGYFMISNRNISPSV